MDHYKSKDITINAQCMEVTCMLENSRDFIKTFTLFNLIFEFICRQLTNYVLILDLMETQELDKEREII